MNPRDRIILWLVLGVLMLWGVHWLGASKPPASAVQDQYLSFDWPQGAQTGALYYDHSLINTNEYPGQHPVSEENLTLVQMMERIRQIAGYEYFGAAGETMILHRRVLTSPPQPDRNGPDFGVLPDPGPPHPGPPPAPVVSAVSAPWQYFTFHWPEGTARALFYFSPQDIQTEFQPPLGHCGSLAAVLFHAHHAAGFDFFAAAGDTVILRRPAPAGPSAASLDISNMWVIPDPPSNDDWDRDTFEPIRIPTPNNKGS